MIAIHWFRRDLRLEDNISLHHALTENTSVLPIFIFDSNIIDELPRDDARLSFIYAQLHRIHEQLRQIGSGVLILRGDPTKVWSDLIASYSIDKVYINHDYEPYSRTRDHEVAQLLIKHNIPIQTFKDQVIFEKDEVIKSDGTPYTVFTPYKNKWLERLKNYPPQISAFNNVGNFHSHAPPFPSLKEDGDSQ